MKLNIYLAILLSLVFVACSNPLEQKEKQLIEDIHRIHDVETMPKMGKLEALKAQLDTFQGVEKTVIFDRKKELDNGYESMMSWMHQFNWQSDKTPIEERVKYYEEQVKKLEDMKKVMYDGMEHATQTLKQ